MTPSEAFVETMAANGVTEIFGIMGSAFMDAMDIFAPAGITLIPVVHEQGAAHMADGYSRVSGRHGVVIGQNGPGISNCVTAIAAAYWAHSPVVMITPETGLLSKSSSTALTAFTFLASFARALGPSVRSFTYPREIPETRVVINKTRIMFARVDFFCFIFT